MNSPVGGAYAQNGRVMREEIRADKRKDGSSPPRVCVCVMMNHPYPANLPLLRRVYAGRFSELLFLIPFAEVDDPDVITVYRGSYAHAAYISDARARLSTIDCDYFLFVHDDVLLNPQFDESSFTDLLPLGRDDGFIPWVYKTPDRLGEWIWYFALLPRLLHPKSLLFGSGIEPNNLLRYLPTADEIRAGFVRSGATFTERVTISLPTVEEAGPRAHPAAGSPSVVVLDGLAAALDHADPTQRRINEHTLATLEELTAALAEAASRQGIADEARTIKLPIPLAASAYFTDCYVVPRSRFDRFAHYMGVAGAAGLFVEIIAPTILHAVCDRVHTAATLDLNFEGFHRARRLEEFRDRKVIASHPFKFSMFKEPAQADGFMRIVDTLRTGGLLRPEMAAAAGLDASHTDTMKETGWHILEAWGRWSAERFATLKLVAPARQGVIRFRLRAPRLVGHHVNTSGSITLAGGASVSFVIPPTQSGLLIDVPFTTPRTGDALSITVKNDALICPRDFDTASPDPRWLGVGLAEIAFH
ncbi:hypothetical protein [Sphingomonas radiodurans]|uniref:hypothetical protein n=1 Tax=Sphingomonas radiodurans TaxID=2890321 RepID=UPI001E562BE5|nr:hypothetical protein [Sphingomonas radiodurans]WBH17442.1 hypothetical protein LLW23_04870 [Sphingomonas radiodurans]